MTSFLIISFAITVIYLIRTERFRSYVSLIGLQGLFLFGLSMLELNEMNWGIMLFIIAETLIVKAIVIPFLLQRIINRTKITKIHEDAMPSFYSLIFISIGLIISIMLAYYLNDSKFNQFYFPVALFTLFAGMFLIIARKKIFSHLIGFLVIENSVFLLSLAIGNEIPVLINLGILLDIFVSVLILGIFITRIGYRLRDIHSDSLTVLKD